MPVDPRQVINQYNRLLDRKFPPRFFRKSPQFPKGTLDIALWWVVQHYESTAGITKPVLPTTPDTRFSNGKIPTVVVNRMSDAVTRLPA
jgi:hypothetical protein